MLSNSIYIYLYSTQFDEKFMEKIKSIVSIHGGLIDLKLCIEYLTNVEDYDFNNKN